MDTATWAFVLALGINLGGLIWGASRLTTVVDGLRKAVDTLDRTARHLQSTVGTLDRRVAVLEDRHTRDK